MANDPSEKQREVKVGLVCALAFWQLADPFLHRIAEAIPEGSVTPFEIGELVACATNLAFALELYMKTLLAQAQLPVPKHHDLGKLYESLPDDVQSEVEAAYDRARPYWHGRRRSISVASGPLEAPEWHDDPTESQALAHVLQRSGDVFSSWRYVYEFTAPTAGAYHFRRFEYGMLQCVCIAMNESITHRMELAAGSKSTPG